MYPFFIKSLTKLESSKYLKFSLNPPISKKTFLFTNINAPHFVFYVRNQLIKKFGDQVVESGGLRVTTSLDLDMQQKAEWIVNQEVKKLNHSK